MKKLLRGIVEFREKSLTQYREKFSNLATGQSPDALLIACCDSRVAPNTFASTDPGDLFVLRNIGNLVPPYHLPNEHGDTSVLAAIEFALANLAVIDIIICGHSECAAMQFFTNPSHTHELNFLQQWLKNAAPSYERYQQIKHSYSQKKLTPHNLLSQINVLQQLDHLKTYPAVQEHLANGKLQLHAWWFELATADVYQYEEKENDFVLIDAKHAAEILANSQKLN